MRILYVSSLYPCPAISGAHLRVLNIARLLREIGDVTLLVTTPQPDAAREQATRKEFERMMVMPTRFIEVGGLVNRFRGIADPRWLKGHGQVVSEADAATFKRLHAGHDLAWFHTLTTVDRFLTYRLPRSFVDMDDLNHVKYDMAWRTQGPWKDRLTAKWRAMWWRSREMDAPRRFSAVGVCSERDRMLLGNAPGVHVIPNGFSAPSPVVRRPTLRLGYIGSLDYWPNRDGLDWFANAVWPALRCRMPDVRLRIVGKGPHLASLDQPGIDSLGFVEDPTEEFGSWAAMVVPLRIGGGTRLKILEAFSRRCPVISTAVGAYGLDAKADEHLLLADTPSDMVKAVSRLLSDQTLADALVDQAWRLYDTRYRWQCVAPAVRLAVQACLAGEAAEPATARGSL